MDYNSNSDNRIITKESVKQLAIDSFPDYADRISYCFSAPAIILPLSRSSDYVILSVTHPVSECEDITYVEYSSGIAELIYSSNEYIISNTTNGFVSTRKSNFWIFCNLSSDSNLIQNFTYQFVRDSFDSISSTGTTSGTWTNPQVTSYKPYEDATGAAYAKYSCAFSVYLPDSDIPFTHYTTFSITIGNDTISRTVQ